MASIDIRDSSSPTVDRIVFADNEDNKAYILLKDIRRIEIHDDCDFIMLHSEEHVRDLIQALEKALELEWL